MSSTTLRQSENILSMTSTQSVGELDLNLLEKALKRLIDILEAETQLLKDSSADIMQYYDEKCDLIQFIEWQREAIISYLADNRKTPDNTSANNTCKNVIAKETTSLPDRIKIRDLLKLMYAALNENIQQISRRKFTNDCIVAVVSSVMKKQTNLLTNYDRKGNTKADPNPVKSPCLIYNKIS